MDKIEALEKQVLDLSNKLDFIINLMQGTSVNPQAVPCEYTLFSWLEEWYNTYKAPKLKKSSLREIRTCIGKHIKLNIEDKPLNQITGLEIQKALNKIEQSRTKKYTYNVYNGAFKQAVKLDIISNNPMVSVDSVAHKYKQGKALSREQQAYFYKVLDGHKLRALFEFFILSGCRRGEAVALQWSDVDFKNKLLHIRGTKTEGSNRTIPLFPAIAELLSILPREDKTVFNTNANAVNCSFKRLKAHYNLTFRVHDLRHTFATRCLENGISLKTIQKWLGHSRLETTSNIYTHVMTDFEREEIAKFNPKI